MDLCSELMGTLCFLGLEHLFWWWFELQLSVVLRPCNIDCICTRSHFTTLSILRSKIYRVRVYSEFFPTHMLQRSMLFINFYMIIIKDISMRMFSKVTTC